MSLQRSKMLGSSCNSRGRMVLAAWIIWKLLWSRISPTSWKTMFLSPTQALSVQKALHEDMNLTPDMKASVNASIDASLTRDSNNNESAHGPKPQKINVSPYLTMSDWDIIKNSQNYHSKVAAVCKRLRSLGVRSLAEQSVKHAVGAILSGYKEMPDQSIMYQMVQDIKLGFVSHPMVHTGPVVVKYPEDPTKLPGQLYAQSYPNEHPAQIIPDQLPMILKLIPLRLTHAAIAKARPVQAAPSGGSPSASSLSSQGAFAPLVDVANSFGSTCERPCQKAIFRGVALDHESQCCAWSASSFPCRAWEL